MNDVLWISLIGAGMVFLGLIILWFLMDLLVRATSIKKKENTPDVSNDLGKEKNLLYKQKAAAASVAVSIALLNTSFLSSPHNSNQGMSSWQITNRNQQVHNRVRNIYRNRVIK